MTKFVLFLMNWTNYIFSLFPHTFLGNENVVVEIKDHFTFETKEPQKALKIMLTVRVRLKLCRYSFAKQL